MKGFTSYFLLFQVIIVAIFLPIIAYHIPNSSTISGYPEEINKNFLYQPITLIIAFVFLVILRSTKKEAFFTFFRKGDLSKIMKAEPLIGINPKKNESWKKAGSEITLIITLITAVTCYFQINTNSIFSLDVLLSVFPWVLFFAFINSFVEEVILRLGVVVALKGEFNDRLIAFISGLIFGGVHYFGHPGGIVGVVMAGFLGWFLAKSILETKGIFFAWLVHFIQDIIIMTALFIA